MTQPDYEQVPIVPKAAEAGSLGLWTPTNVRYIQSWLVGEYIDNNGNKQRAFKHEFELSYMGRTETFGVLVDEDTSDAQIEDLAAFTSGTTMKKIEVKVQRTNDRLRPEDLASRENWDVRRDLAGAWRQYRKWAKRRRASTNMKTLYRGVN